MTGPRHAASPTASRDRRPAETLRLLRLARAGDREATERLIMAHWGLVGRWVRLFGGDRGGQTNDEMESSGLEGLWRAVREFDESRGVKFSTFAVWCIRAAMKPKGWQQRQHRSESHGREELGRSGGTLETLAVAREESPPPPASLPADVMAMLSGLTGREQAAFRLHFGFPPAEGDAKFRLTGVLASLIVSIFLPRLRVAAGSDEADGLAEAA